MSRPVSQHRQRTQRVSLLASKATVALALGWAVYFAGCAQWLPAVLDVGAAAAALLAFVLNRRGYSRAGTFILIVTTYAALLLSAAFLDVPTARVARGIHEFFPALGIGAMVTLRRESAWLRHGFPIACFAAFVFFAGVDPVWRTPYAVADSVRVWSVWIDHVGAMAALFLVVRVIQTDSVDRRAAELELGHALLHGQFELFFQPQVDAAGQAFGAEALIRWRHPVRGLVFPNDFIPLAERSGLMPPLGDWVLRAACQQLARWEADPALAHLQIAVNVSASQFEDPDFAQRVLEIVRQARARPSRLKLELTESMLAHDLDDVLGKMSLIKAAGIGFSLDDFGTGFSSLAYLRQLPFDQLKIDQAFVRDMLGSSKDVAIVHAVVALGASLGLQVIAEGVETDDHRRLLADAGCDRYQGYLFSKPIPAGEFEALLRRGIPMPPPSADAATPRAPALADAGLSAP